MPGSRRGVPPLPSSTPTPARGRGRGAGWGSTQRTRSAACVAQWLSWPESAAPAVESAAPGGRALWPETPLPRQPVDRCPGAGTGTGPRRESATREGEGELCLYPVALTRRSKKITCGEEHCGYIPHFEGGGRQMQCLASLAATALLVAPQPRHSLPRPRHAPPVCAAPEFIFDLPEDRSSIKFGCRQKSITLVKPEARGSLHDFVSGSADAIVLSSWEPGAVRRKEGTTDEFYINCEEFNFVALRFAVELQ